MASRCAIGVSPAETRATCPPHGNMIDWHADGTGMRSECDANTSIASSLSSSR